MAKKKSPKKIVPSDTFSISLKLGNILLNGRGATALEALQSIEAPLKVTTKGILTVKKGEKVREHVLMPFRVKRLFFPSAQFFQAKNLEVGMG